MSVASEGELVAGRYRLRRPIERGGMAEVWEGHDENLDRAVAIKMLHGHLSGDAGFVSRFRREALSIAKLSHPNVVAIFDTGVDQLPPRQTGGPGTTRAYIVMELIRGESLRALLQQGIAIPKAVDIIRQAADGLAYAHRNGLVHRDVKPGNILVQTDGRVKVVDFGIAKLTDRRVDDTETSWAEMATTPGEDLTQAGAILGTAKYLAPEQVDGGVIDARSDIYALGVVLYECVCGRPPFSGKNDLATALRHVHETPTRPRQMRPGIPRSLESIIVKAMEKRPADRYESADDLATALRTIDLSPDDAVPLLSRTANDVTPATPIARSGQPAGNARGTRVGSRDPGSATGSAGSSATTPGHDETRVGSGVPANGRSNTAGQAGGSTAASAPATKAKGDQTGSAVDSRRPERGARSLPSTAMDPTTVAVPGTARSSGATVRASSDPESRAREAQSAPTRRSGRRRRILLPVLAALGLVLGSAAGYAASGVANSSRSGRTLEPVGIAAYDPFGDDNGHENDDFLPNAIDGKPDTTWRTSGYRSSDFSALKPGVGIIVRLTASSSVGHVRLVSPSRGWSAKIFVAEAVPSDFTGWGASVGSIDNVRSNTTTIQLTKTRGTRVLLWITKLAPKAPSQEFTRVIVQEFSPRT